jgi:ribose transport system substrate-binding protein
MFDLERQLEALDEGTISRTSFLRRGLAAGVSASALAGLANPIARGATTNLRDAEALGHPTNVVPLKRWRPTKVVGPKPTLPRNAVYGILVANEVLVLLGKHMKIGLKEGGIGFLEFNANNNDATYNTQLRTFIQRPVGGVYILDLDWNADKFSAMAALKANICTLCLHQSPGHLVLSEAIFDQGYTSGVAAANFINKQLGGKANIVYMYVIKDKAIAKRKDGALAALKANGGLDKGVLVVDCDAPDAADSNKAMTATLQAHPDVNIVICQNDDIGSGVVSAMQAGGKSDPSKYGVFSVDGNGTALSTIGSGKPSIWKATAASFLPLFGYAPGLFMAEWMNGRTMPQMMLVKPFLLDTKAKIDKWNTDTKNFKPLVHAMLNGDDTYAVPLGSISYATRNNYFTGKVPGQIPKYHK